MEFHRRASPPPLLRLSFFFFLSLFLLQTPASAAKKSYIVYLGAHSHGSPEAALLAQESVENSHHELLAPVLKSKEKAKHAIFYSYTKHINGFAAKLEEDEAKEISKNPGVISVFLDRGRKLHTTHSWQFLNLERNGRMLQSSIWEKARFGEDTIIANLDTGVWPESESFSDEGYSPVPARWRGACVDDSDQNTRFICNRKLIGGRYYKKGYESFYGAVNSSFNNPRDLEGHGSHTLSTAAGNFVANANFHGLGNGTAKGGSSRARVAAYKVCWPPGNFGGCFDADMLAAFDQAIHDGVDVLSLSLGSQPLNYFEDGLAIGAFHAVAKGVPVIFSAGNSGPQPGSANNVAPWMFTVAASTMDREFVSSLHYEDQVLKGVSLSSTSLPCKEFYPTINSADAYLLPSLPDDARYCIPDSLDPKKVEGKIVVCQQGLIDGPQKGKVVLQAGGAGMVLVSGANEVFPEPYVLPATKISYSDGQKLLSYLSSSKTPLAYISPPETDINVDPAPIMAIFSAQGPNKITPEILKPDITAPGVSILAAFSRAADPSPYYVLSGTSMSCPHVAGVVGLLKTLHPDWSPAMIKSAIMTTAMTQGKDKEPIKNSTLAKATPFNYGSGHMRPNRAMDPGLVYDLSTHDYLNFLCGLGYNSTTLATFSDETYKCPSKPLRLIDLNYPSITVPNLHGSITATRTVKNVGRPSTYRVRVHAPRGISVAVKPKVLVFEEFGEEKKFEVTVKLANGEMAVDYTFGSLVWSDGKHYVRSPLVVKSSGFGLQS